MYDDFALFIETKHIKVIGRRMLPFDLKNKKAQGTFRDIFFGKAYSYRPICCEIRIGLD